MARRTDAERIRHAKMTGAVMAIRDQVRLDTEARFERLRSEWPEMADRIESAVEHIGW